MKNIGNHCCREWDSEVVRETQEGEWQAVPGLVRGWC